MLRELGGNRGATGRSLGADQAEPGQPVPVRTEGSQAAAIRAADDRARVVREAGPASRVSGPTISRFVTGQLGFESYAAFQAALHEEISARMTSPVETYRGYWGEQQPNDLLLRSGAALGEAVTATVQSTRP